MILFPPHEFHNLYYVGRPKGHLLYDYPTDAWIRDPQNVDTSHGFVFGSSVNIDRPDLKRHPKFAETAAPLRALLNAGDVLYLPSFWHHEVQSIPDVDLDKLNIAVNFWFANVTAPIPGM